MLTTILGYLVVAGFFFLDRSRKGRAAQSFEAGQADHGSTLYIGLAYLVSMLALLASWLFNDLKLGRLPAWVGWLGVAIAVCGWLLRWWANRVLGAFYTRTLQVLDQQAIVSSGPYRLIRHPGYLGSILIWVGAAIASANGIVLLIVFISMLSAYAYRMRREEEMLLSAVPGYADYRSRTWRLIPPLY